MNTSGLVKRAGAPFALALCSACGAPQPAAALNAGYVAVTAARVNLNPLPRYATTVPELRAKGTFEYVINFYGTYAGIFDYPKSTKQIGTINNVGGQGCTNVLYGYGRKTFWIVAGVNQITEYEIPQKPIKTLEAPAGSMPSSCAMNFAGDLAVGILNYTDAGDVVIYKHASGSGTVFPTPLAKEFFDGYDNQGNLFADGSNRIRSGAFELVELPKGSSKFETIATSNVVGFPGSVQWDGKYLTILSQSQNSIYRYTVSGAKAALKDTVMLRGAADCAQTWIVKGLVYCADAGNNIGAVYKYPAGGSPIAVFTGNFDSPLGVVAAAK